MKNQSHIFLLTWCLLTLSTLGQSRTFFEENPPVDYLVHLQYHLETQSIFGLPSSLDAEALSPFQLSRYHRENSSKQYNIYLDQEGQFFTEINYIHTEDAAPQNKAAIGKVAISNLGTTIYDTEGKAKQYVEHSPKYHAYNTILGQSSLLNLDQLGAFPFPLNLEDHHIGQFENKGYTVEISSANSYRLIRSRQEISVEAAIGSYQINQFDEEGNLLSTQQYLYQPNTENQWLPFQTLRTTYITDAYGNCSTNIEMERYSNYQIIYNTSTPRHKALASPPSNFAFQIFPNPAKGMVSLRLPRTNTTDVHWTIEVFDLLGKKMGSHSSANTQVNLNISSLTKGIYLVKVSNGQQTFCNKFSKI